MNLFVFSKGYTVTDACMRHKRRFVLLCKSLCKRQHCLNNPVLKVMYHKSLMVILSGRDVAASVSNFKDKTTVDWLKDTKTLWHRLGRPKC